MSSLLPYCIENTIYISKMLGAMVVGTHDGPQKLDAPVCLNNHIWSDYDVAPVLLAGVPLPLASLALVEMHNMADDDVRLLSSGGCYHSSLCEYRAVLVHLAPQDQPGFAQGQARTYLAAGIFAGHDPTRGSGQECFDFFTGWVGSGRVSNFSNSNGSGRVILTRPDPI